MAKPRHPGVPFSDGSMKWDDLETLLGNADAPGRVDGPRPADKPASGGGGRLIDPNPLDGSDTEELEDLVASEMFWELLEAHEESRNRGQRGPKRGRPRQYVPADIVVIEAATHQNSSARSTLRNLKDPKTWKRLRKAAKKSFPDNKARRLSKNAPNRWQIYRAQRSLFSGENLQEFRRLMRHQNLKGALHIGCFDPAAGTWTHPDKTQCIAADASWIRSATQYDRSVLLDPGSKVQRFDPNAYHHHYSNNEPTKFPGREVVMLTCRSNFGNERVILDSDVLPHKDHHSRKGRNDADFAVDMLADLISEHRSLLGGLRGFTYDMAMDSEAIDNVLAKRVIPIVKTQKLPNSKYRHGNIGPHDFKLRNGQTRKLEIKTVNGSMFVKLPDSHGTALAIPLERRHFRWGDETNDGDNTAYLKVRIPDNSGASAASRAPRPQCGSTAPRRRSTPSPTPAAPGRCAPSPKPTPTSTCTAAARTSSPRSRISRTGSAPSCAPTSRTASGSTSSPISFCGCRGR